MKNELGGPPTEYSNVIEVQNPVEGLTLVAAEYVPLPPGELVFSLKPDTTLLEPVGSLKVNIMFGNGHSSVHTRDIVNNSDFACSYSDVGVYTLEVNISNHISSQILQHRLEVLEQITGVAFSTYFEGEELMPAFESGILTVKQNEVIVFMSSCDTGTNVTYKWTFGNAPAIETSEEKVTHKFPRGGDSFLILAASNEVDEDVTVSMQLFVKPTLEVKDVICPDSVVITTELLYNLTLVGPVERLCVCFSLYGGEQDILFWRGTSTDICKEVLPPGVSFDPTAVNFKKMHIGDVHLPVTQVMNKLGKYKLTVELYSDGVALKETNDFSVDPMICKKPVVKLKELLGSTRDMPYVIEKGSGQNLSPSLFAIKINCSIHKKVESMWDIFSYDVVNDTVTTKKLTLDSIRAEVIAGEFIVPPGVLSCGMYMYQINVAMTAVKEKCGHGSLFMKIVNGPLKVSIRYNSHRVVGENQMIDMNAVDVSVDPDEPQDKTGMAFTWFCRNIDESPVDQLGNYTTVPLPTAGESYFITWGLLKTSLF